MAKATKSHQRPFTYGFDNDLHSFRIDDEVTITFRILTCGRYHRL